MLGVIAGIAATVLGGLAAFFRRRQKAAEAEVRSIGATRAAVTQDLATTAGELLRQSGEVAVRKVAGQMQTGTGKVIIGRVLDGAAKHEA